MNLTTDLIYNFRESVMLYGRRCDAVQHPYPLPSFPTHVYDVAHEVKRNMQVSDVLVGMTLIQAMTVACQGLIDVEMPIGRVAPVTQNLLMILKSGDRKTAVFNKLLKPFIDHDSRAVAEFDTSKAKYEAELKIWQAKEQGLLRALKREVAKGQECSELEAEVVKHGREKPALPKLRTFLHSNVTPKSIIESLSGSDESLCVTNDEGHELFSGHLMREFGVLNKLWDSPETLSVERADNKVTTALSPRASMAIMTQWEPLHAYIDKRGDVARGSGFFARFLVGKPMSLQGYRQVNVGATWNETKQYYERINALIGEYDEFKRTSDSKRKIMKFKSEAVSRWYQISQLIEDELKQDRHLYEVSDFGSKLMEMISRLAATMHYFETGDSGISLLSLNRAFEIIKWHVSEFLYVFRDGFVSQEEKDRINLLRWLKSTRYNGFNSYIVGKNEMLQRGPVRVAARLNPLVERLVYEGYLFRYTDNMNFSRKKLFMLNNARFSEILP